MSDLELKVKLVDPSIPQEQKAVGFARTSRDPRGFEEIIPEVTAEGAGKFIEKWVLRYGHNSIREHAVLSVTFERISRLATETIESCRLGSFSEKSSRYQIFDPKAYTIPPEIVEEGLKTEYVDGLNSIMNNYGEMSKTLIPYFFETGKKLPNEKKAE